MQLRKPTDGKGMSVAPRSPCVSPAPPSGGASRLRWDREPAFLQARRRHQAQRRSLPDGVWGGSVDGDLATWPGLPYVLLFLEWEARYPLEWTQHAKAWGTKQSLIRKVARARQE